jgi:hypothetical protein
VSSIGERASQYLCPPACFAADDWIIVILSEIVIAVVTRSPSAGADGDAEQAALIIRDNAAAAGQKSAAFGQVVSAGRDSNHPNLLIRSQKQLFHGMSPC